MNTAMVDGTAIGSVAGLGTVEFLKGLDIAISRWVAVSNSINANVAAFEGALFAAVDTWNEQLRTEIRTRLDARKDLPVVEPGRLYRELEAEFSVMDTCRQIQLLEELRSGEFERRQLSQC